MTTPITSVNYTATASTSISLTSSPTANTLMVLFGVALGPTSVTAPMSVTDDGFGTWNVLTTATKFSGSKHTIQCAYKFSSGSETSVTAQFVGANSVGVYYFNTADVTGSMTIDTILSNPILSSTTASTGTFKSNFKGEFVLACAGFGFPRSNAVGVTTWAGSGGFSTQSLTGVPYTVGGTITDSNIYGGWTTFASTFPSTLPGSGAFSFTTDNASTTAMGVLTLSFVGGSYSGGIVTIL